MPRNDGRLVKDARSNLEAAEQAARVGGICEDQLANDSAVRAAGDRLTVAQASEHLQLMHSRLHAIKKKSEVKDGDAQQRDRGNSGRKDARQMAEHHIISRCVDGEWSAAYSDRPEERFYGVTKDEAIGRLTKMRGAPEGPSSGSPVAPAS